MIGIRVGILILRAVKGNIIGIRVGILIFKGRLSGSGLSGGQWFRFRVEGVGQQDKGLGFRV